MKYDVVILEEVYFDLEDAADFYYSVKPGLEQELFKEWLICIEKISKSPASYQKQRKQFRQVLLERFPFLIIFEIKDSSVLVYRFINARRDPKKRFKNR